MSPEARRAIDTLGLQPHPEGGWYRQTWAAEGPGRPAGTCIYFLLAAGQRSHWHRVDATEIWHFYAGAALELEIADGDARSSARTSIVLGTDFAAGMVAHGVVPARAWQSARSLGAWTLVGCTVAPAFEFSGFELAPAEPAQIGG